MFRFITIDGMKHSTATIINNKEKPHELNIIQQSSNKFMPMQFIKSNLLKEPSIISVDKSMVEKPGVFNWKPYTVDLKKEKKIFLGFVQSSLLGPN